MLNKILNLKKENKIKSVYKQLYKINSVDTGMSTEIYHSFCYSLLLNILFVLFIFSTKNLTD